MLLKTWVKMTAKRVLHKTYVEKVAQTLIIESPPEVEAALWSRGCKKHLEHLVERPSGCCTGRRRS